MILLSKMILNKPEPQQNSPVSIQSERIQKFRRNCKILAEHHNNIVIIIIIIIIMMMTLFQCQSIQLDTFLRTSTLIYYMTFKLMILPKNYVQMYTTHHLQRSQQLLLLSIWLERSTSRICFLNALRLVKFPSSLLTFDQMKGPW